MDWREWDALRAPRGRELDFGHLCQAAARWKRWLIGLPLAASLLIGMVLCLQAPVYSAEATISIGSSPSGLIGLRSHAAFLESRGGCGFGISHAHLIASRDLARRAISDLGLDGNAELDPAESLLGPASRALIFLGVIRDWRRQAQEDRVLQAFQQRLRVSGPGKEGLLTIAFQSQDSELAANAANRVAELYLDMRKDAGRPMPCAGRAWIVSRAAPPPSPVYPKDALLILSGVTMIVTGLGACVAIALPRLPFARRTEVPLKQPRALGQARVFARLKVIPQRRARWALRPGAPPAGEPEAGAADNGQAVAKIAARILAAPAHGLRGTCILATSLEASADAACLMLAVARSLAWQRRSIAICLDGSSPLDPTSLSAAVQQQDGPGAQLALSDLVAGTASFAEVIRRDPASRLHILQAASKDGACLDELSAVLDALAAAYDFIILLAPPIGCGEAAASLAAAADFALLAVPAEPCGAAFDAERQLIESGAREVILAGLARSIRQGSMRDAA
jgi:hypothetical protein